MKLTDPNTLSSSSAETGLKNELELIKSRNARVEADKAWEGSATRIGMISLITYVVAASVLFLLGAKRFWLDACIPPIGFFLSTQSLPKIKEWWLKNRYNN
jgi:hypothetical protein